jgi:GNAT superfamily N-acetyltransferase
MANTAISDFEVRTAVEDDVPLILQFIRKLAQYERLSHEMVATEEMLRGTLFGGKRTAEVIIGEYRRSPVGFAIYFHNYSTFLGRPGIYIEDLYVDEEHRGHGFGFALFQHIVGLAKERKCGRLEWAVLDWNDPAIQFYKKLGAVAMSDWTVYRLTGEALDRLAQTDEGEEGINQI